MMTLKRNIEENQDYLEEGLNLRSVSGIVLVGKIQTTSKQLKSIKKPKKIHLCGSCFGKFNGLIKWFNKCIFV